MPRHAHQDPNILRLKRLGIDTYRELVIYMTADCPVCRSTCPNVWRRPVAALANR